MTIRIENVSKTFRTFKALDRVSLTIKPGEILALLGPSGSGKTTLLRIVSGLDQPDNGHIKFGETDVTRTPAHQRQVGFVFQHYTLFRHLTVYDNIAFGLQVKQIPKQKIRALVLQLLEQIQLEGLGSRFPQQISGGQRQRVAFARALATNPSVLLLDEPFGALDAKVRRELRQWLQEFQSVRKLTALFVTHDQEEAALLADRVAIFNHGAVQQIGTINQLRASPANDFVDDFLLT
jgi:sulfate transport system ATP-binding protein